jgi:SAM-dependent methyltransferase
MSGNGLDIGYRGARKDAVPVLSTAIGIELDYPGYDGKTLPFPDESQEYVFASHVLEHIVDYKQAIQEWMRVLRTSGHLVICVPHMFLYEKKWDLPSRYNADHKRFYTPGSLLIEVENSLKPNTYRIAHLRDNDDGYNYSIPPEKHCAGACEIELVIEKIKPPTWEIK